MSEASVSLNLVLRCRVNAYILVRIYKKRMFDVVFKLKGIAWFESEKFEP